MSYGSILLASATMGLLVACGGADRGVAPSATAAAPRVTAAAAPAPSAARAGRHAAPEDAVKAYFASQNRCSSQLLRSAFHPAAHIVREDAGALRSTAQLAWWKIIEAKNPCPQALEQRMKVLDREGPMALVETASRYTTHQFHDYLLVVDTPDGWLIVDKIFEHLRPDESPSVNAADQSAVRQILADKIKAAADNDPMLLATTHTDDCIYSRVNAGGSAYGRESVSEWAAKYAGRRDRGEDGREAKWNIVAVGVSGKIAFAKLEVVSRGTRYVDHLLLLRAPDGWRIAAAVWGNPA